MSESTDLTNSILIAIPKNFPGARAWRRNVGGAVGMGTVQKAIACLGRHEIAEAIKLLRIPIRFGVEGEGDIDGAVPIASIACRLCVEVKVGKDKLRPGQEAFRDMLLRMGGVWVEARSVDQAMRDIRFQVDQKEKMLRGVGA